MNDDDDARRRELSQRIEERQAELLSYLRMARPRQKLLANVSIIGSAVVAAITAGPGIGGTGFTDALANTMSLSGGGVVWRVICLGAAILSVITAVATKMATSRQGPERIAAAEASHIELKGLHAAIAYGDLPLTEAATRYKESLAKASFVDSATAGTTHSRT